MAETRYTVDIPGLQDIVILTPPSLDDFELRRQRIQRMKTKTSPIPSFLQWIPPMINAFDDVEDMLSVGLTLAKPLLKRVGTRFIPYVGWALLLTDVLDLVNFLLGIGLGGTFAKGDVADAIKAMVVRKDQVITKAADWFARRTNLFGFALEAGQVLDNLVGVGLRLGPLMGLISDARWGAVRALGGQKVVVRGPPPADPLGKLSNYFLGTNQLRAAPQIFSPEAELLIAADHVAYDLALDQGNLRPILGARLAEFSTTQAPAKEVWNPASREALRAEGIDPDSTLTWRPQDLDLVFAVSELFPQFAGDAVSILLRNTPTMPDMVGGSMRFVASNWERALTEQMNTERGGIFSRIYIESSDLAWQTWLDSPADINFAPQDEQLHVLKAYENNVFPCRDLTTDELELWIQAAQRDAIRTGRRSPVEENLINSALEVLGCWQRR